MREEFLKRKSEGGKEEGSVLQTPEKERAPQHQIADLQLTPVHQQRKEEDAMPSPLPTLPLVCELAKYGSMWNTPCGQTFSSEDELRVHAHLGHLLCNRERYSTPCPWDGCISHESKQ